MDNPAPPPAKVPFVGPVTAPAPERPSQPSGRLTVVGQVAYQGAPSVAEPFAVAVQWARWLCDDVQPFGPRRILVPTDWELLDLGWVNNPGYIVISNEEGKNLQVVPTPEEQRDVALRVVEIGVWTVGAGAVGFSQLSPGEAMGFTPLSDAGYVLRCPAGGGKVRCYVTILPR